MTDVVKKINAVLEANEPFLHPSIVDALRGAVTEIERLKEIIDEQSNADIREIRLKAALRAFLELSWSPDAAPGPSFYLVDPVDGARKAIRDAGVLLDGKSPFPSDNNGSVTIFPSGKRAVWLDGMAYAEDKRELVPSRHLALFDQALGKTRGDDDGA